jgi:phosphatidylglycerophosphatase A
MTMRGGITRIKIVASALGLGHLPVAPGTWGSAGAAAVYVALRSLPGAAWRVALCVLFLAVLALGLWAAPRAEKAYGKSDPGPFVLDEVAGVWLTCLAFRWRGPLVTAIAAFAAFRVFDIAKPFPVRRLEDLPGGWGVMMDDLAAAAYSVALLWPLCYGVLDRVLSA